MRDAVLEDPLGLAPFDLKDGVLASAEDVDGDSELHEKPPAKLVKERGKSFQDGMQKPNPHPGKKRDKVEDQRVGRTAKPKCSLVEFGLALEIWSV